VIERILPGTVIAVEAYDDAVPVMLFPAEEELVRNAVPKRRAEFATARRCAREALGRLGRPPAPLLRGERGAPVWPSGIAGSITHCAGYRAAAVALLGRVSALGVDAEPDLPLPPGVLESVAQPAEVELLARLPAGTHWDRLLFCAKEAVFKTWYPVTRRELWFEEAHVEIDPAGTFTAELLVAGPWKALSGRFLAESGLLVAVIALPA
jgi:4'-phosphopantetheinyl transferase EntD